MASEIVFKPTLIPDEILPELFLLGTLEHTEESLDDGRIVRQDVIKYDGKIYIMKVEEVGKWFGDYHEIVKH